ncbi:MAG: MopE-related protein [Bradymonadaceae bacterium]
MYCNATSCVAKKGHGAECEADHQCLSGYCQRSAPSARGACIGPNPGLTGGGDITARSEYCGDGVDNDCDGVVDESDNASTEICGDGSDNDCDGAIDENMRRRCENWQRYCRSWDRRCTNYERRCTDGIMRPQIPGERLWHERREICFEWERVCTNHTRTCANWDRRCTNWSRYCP